LITPIFFLLLAEGETSPAFLGRVFIMAMVYANAIGFPANWTIRGSIRDWLRSHPQLNGPHCWLRSLP
jgi:hypothetical protein